MWSAAAYFLWDSTIVPGNLHPPSLSPHRFFSPHAIARASSYERFEEIDWILSELALLIVFAVYAWRGARFARESAAGRIGTGMLLGMLAFAISWLAQLPFGVADLWWQRRHDISRINYFEWIVNSWFSLGSVFLFICLAIVIVMGLAGPLPHRWWVVGGPVFVGLAVLFAFLQPWLTPGLHRLDDPALVASAKELERAEGVEGTPVDEEDVEQLTSSPNSEAAGFGPSRRVIVWDTLLDGRFSDPEIRFVLAHEFGHLARRHIPKLLAWYALFALPGAFLIAVAVRGRGGMRNAEAVPLALFVLVVLQLLAQPLQSAISRHIEAEADWMALRTTRDARSGVALFRHLTTTTLSEPNPATWEYLLLENHPTPMQRLAMVKAWQARYATSVAQSP